MKKIITRYLIAVAFLMVLHQGITCAEDATGIAYKPDPPIVIDGTLSDWERLPGELILDQKTQIVEGASQWKSKSDLSGTARFAWRNEQLYLAVDVVDDQFQQSHAGRAVFQGDHILLTIDASPADDPKRSKFGKGQFQFAISPGNFKQTGNRQTDIPPSIWQKVPKSQAVENVDVASMRTEHGWTIETSIPWSLLGITKPEQGLFLRMGIELVDVDLSNQEQQPLKMSLSGKLMDNRARLHDFILTGADGVVKPAEHGFEIIETIKLARGEKKEFKFQVPARPRGLDVIISLKARIDFKTVAGRAAALSLELNGTRLNGLRLLHKSGQMKDRGGNLYSVGAVEVIQAFYSPDFNAPDQHSHYGLTGGLKACLFEFRVTDLIQQGDNTLVVMNGARAGLKPPLVVGEGIVSFRRPRPPETKAGAPTGPLKIFQPQQNRQADTQVKKLADSKIEVVVSGERYLVESRFSTPAPKWETGSNHYFKHQRRITQASNVITIHDTLKNLTDNNLGVMHRHQIQKDQRIKKIWLAGLEKVTLQGVSTQPANPTTLLVTEKTGLGLLPLDDVFRVHVNNYATATHVGLADNYLVLKPGETRTISWAVLPVSQPDYWMFINSARRLVGANFLIPGGSAFLRPGKLTEQWSDQQVNDFIRYKDPLFIASGISRPRYKGMYSHGTAFQKVSHDIYRKAFTRWRRLQPNRKYLVYFHCFIDVVEDSPERFKDSRTLTISGKQADYGQDAYKLFYPTFTNSYGKAIGKNVEIILEEIGADGVYWDEHEFSSVRYHYGGPWDGVSGIIDLRTMQITRLKSSVTLLSEKWRVAMAKRIMKQGPLLGNGAPHTQAIAALKFPCFIETGNITNCTQGHLYSPIALGDHLTERNETDAYRHMLAALDFGSLYDWYNDMTVIPTHKTLTSYMYPITPVEIHSGYIFGQERIITCKSGLYGWGDNSKHEVHVFNDSGEEVKEFKAPYIIRQGKSYTELRLAEDYSAVIIKRPE